MVPSTDFQVLIISSLFALASVNENLSVLSVQALKILPIKQKNTQCNCASKIRPSFYLISIVLRMYFIAKNYSIKLTLCRNREQVIIHGITWVVRIMESIYKLHIAK